METTIKACLLSHRGPILQTCGDLGRVAPTYLLVELTDWKKFGLIVVCAAAQSPSLFSEIIPYCYFSGLKTGVLFILRRTCIQFKMDVSSTFCVSPTIYVCDIFALGKCSKYHFCVFLKKQGREGRALL